MLMPRLSELSRVSAVDILEEAFGEPCNFHIRRVLKYWETIRL